MTKIDKLDYLDVSKNVLRFLTPEQHNHINQIKYSVTFNKGENIFKQGTPMPHIIVIKEGLGKVFLEEENKRNIILKIIKPGEILGGPGFFTDYKHHFSLTALEDTTAYFIDIYEFKKLVLDNAEFGIELIAYLNLAHINIYKKLRVISHKHMNGRLASTLLYLSNGIYNSDNFDTTLTRQDIADLSSMTKESAIRILKELKTSNIINCTNNHFDILNKEALVNIVENG